jgi:hypothetical protein
MLDQAHDARAAQGKEENKSQTPYSSAPAGI